MGKVSGPGDIAKQRFKSRIYTRHIQQAKRSNPQAFCRLLPQTHSDPCPSHPSFHPALLIQALFSYPLLFSPLFASSHFLHLHYSIQNTTASQRTGQSTRQTSRALHSSHLDLPLSLFPFYLSLHTTEYLPHVAVHD